MAEPGKAAEDPVDALEKELDHARRLLGVQGELEEALRTAANPKTILELVRQSETALAGMARAAHERRRWFAGPNSLEPFLADRPAPEAARLRVLAEEAKRLGVQIRRSAFRAEYVARRCEEWSRAHYELLTRCLVGAGATYEAPGAVSRGRRAARVFDRSA